MTTAASQYVASRPWAIHPRALDGIEALAERDMESFRTAFDDLPKAAPEMVSARGGDRLADTYATSVRDGVAIVPVRGVISRYSTKMQELCREGTSVEMLAKDLRRCMEEPAIKSVILDVDTPGGEASGIGELASMIRLMSDTRKPIDCYVGNMAASGGLWLASACRSITVHPTAFMGSLGVLQRVDTNQKKGVVNVTSKNAPLKRPDFTTEEGLAVVQGYVDALETQFVSAVAAFRDTTTEKVQSDFGRGGEKIGQDAVNSGMADRTGDFESTLAQLCSGAFQPARRTRVESIPVGDGQPKGAYPKMSLLTKLFGRIAEKNPEALEAALAEGNGTDSDVDAILKRIETSAAKPSATEDEVRARIEAEFKAKLEAETSNVVRNLYANQAKSYFLGLVKAGTLVPADVPALEAAYIDAAVSDAAGKLTFNDAAGKSVERDRLAVLTSLIEAKPAKHSLTQEAIPVDANGHAVLPDGTRALSANGGEVDASQARKSAIRKGTGL